MCESCCSTLRKHYTGSTNSPELCAAFVRVLSAYTCKQCLTVVTDMSAAVSTGNLYCASCGWTAGSKKGRIYTARRAESQPTHGVVCCAAYKDSAPTDPESTLTVWDLFASKNDLAAATGMSVGQVNHALREPFTSKGSRRIRVRFHIIGNMRI